MHSLQLLSVTLVVFGLVAAMLAINRSMRHRRVSASAHGAFAVLLVTGGALLWPVGADLAEFDVLRPGRPVADLYFERLGDGRHRVTLTRLPGGRMQVFDVAGTTWRLDARRLDWRGWAGALGPPSRYQLDRLTTLPGAAGKQDNGSGHEFTLADPATAALWKRAREHEQWRRIVVGQQLYGPELPMTDKARFQLTISDHGLDARAANEAAITAIAGTP